MPPKKKAVKKAPKAPVGRPRKKLGTRVSDLPVVSTLRPRASRSNQDSLALQRARLQFKRDYPRDVKGVDEYKSRALLDAMADATRGPIGNRVLGKAKYELDNLAEALLKAKKEKKPYTIEDGNVYVNADDASGALGALVSAIAGPSVPRIKAAPSASSRRKTTSAPKVVGTPGRKTTVKIAKAPATKRQIDDTYNERTANALEMRKKAEAAREAGDEETFKRLTDKSQNLDRAAKTQRTLGLKKRKAWEDASSGSNVSGPSGVTAEEKEEDTATLTTAQETQALRLVNDVSMNGVTEDGMRAIQAASPVVKKAVVKVLGNMLIDEQEGPKTARERAKERAVERRQEAFKAIEPELQERPERPEPEPERYPLTAKQRAVERAITRYENAPPDVQAAIRGRKNPTEDARVREIKRLDEEAAAQEEEVRRENPRRAPFVSESDQEIARARKSLVGPSTRKASDAATIKAQLSRLKKTETKQAKEVVPFTVNVDPLAQALAAKSTRLKRSEISEAIRNRLKEEEALRQAMVNQAVQEQLQEEELLANLPEQDERSGSLSQAERMQRREEADRRQAQKIPNRDNYNALLKKLRQDRTQTQAATKIQSLLRGRKVRRDAEQDKKDLEDLFIDMQDAEEDGVADDVPELISPSRRITDLDRIQRALAQSSSQQIAVPGTSVRPNDAIVEERMYSPARMSNRQPVAPMALQRIIPPPPPPPAKAKGTRGPQKTLTIRERREFADIVNRPGATEITDEAMRELGLPGVRRTGFDEADLQAQIARLRRPVAERGPEIVLDPLAAALAARRARIGPDVVQVDDTEEDWDTDPNPTGRGLVGGGRSKRFVGGVLRRLRGMGYFNSLDNYLNPMPDVHPIDSMQILRDLKAKQARGEPLGGAMGGTFDGRTDWRVLMDAMKTIPKAPGDPNGGAMGGSVVLSGVPTPMKGGMMGCGKYTLQAVTFPDKDWKSSSSLRWLRSNGIKPIKKADHQGSLFRYRIVDPKGFNDYYTSELMSRGRKINLVYGSP